MHIVAVASAEKGDDIATCLIFISHSLAAAG